MKVGSWLVAAVALGPAAAAAAVVQFAAPAGYAPAGHLRNAAFAAVLPSGRIVTPFGESVVTGIAALGVGLSPDGRFALVSNDDARQAQARSALDPSLLGGDAIVTVDTATMHVADRFSAPGETYFAGIVTVADPRDAARTLVFAAGGATNAVYVFDLDAAGRLTPDAAHVISIAGPDDAAFDDFGRSSPATLVAAHDGAHVYAVDTEGDRVTAIDTATRTVAGESRPVGFFPFGAALAGDRLVVANEGLMRYARIADPALSPPFLAPPPDAARASSLSIVGLDPTGVFAAASAAGPASLALDEPVDGRRISGGAHPTAIAVTPDGTHAFVAMANVDRIATVALDGAPRVVGGTELRLFDRGPYGTQPVAFALSADGTRLYVALAGLDAIAVLDARDPLHLHRLGLIPTGWYPSALALSRDDRTLFVANTNGFGHDLGLTGDPGGAVTTSAVWSTLQKIDLGAVMLSHTTLATLRNTRETRLVAPAFPRALRNVVVIVAGDTTFDALLGDLGCQACDPADLTFGPAITPNLHALARRFAVAGNFFADATDDAAAHAVGASGLATAFTVRDTILRDARRLPAHADDPEDAPRTGGLDDDLARHGISFRDYGDWLFLAGYDGGAAADPLRDDADFVSSDDRGAPTHGLGGRYGLDVPAAVQLAGNVDLDYPGQNARIRDERRAHEFMRDYTLLVAAHRQPRYTQIWLPADRSAATPGLPPVAERVADGDRALGTIVAYLSHLPAWKNTAIFVLPPTARDTRDHVDPSRTYALVISPFAKRRFVGMRHLSTASVLKTSEQILHLPPVSLGDLLASDMSDFFTARADLRPFDAIPVPVQTDPP